METIDELTTEARALLAAGRREGIEELTGRLGPSDWADLIRRLDPEERERLFDWLPDSVCADLLEELDPSEAATILRGLSQPDAADLLEAMSPDDATDVIGEIPEAEARQILVAMEPAEAAEIRELAAYPPDTAGGIMTPSFTAISPNLRADQAIVALRRVAKEVETIYYVYVLDGQEKLLGVLSLHSLVLADPDTPVRELMFANVISVTADADQETAAQLLTDHNLLALPVIDSEGRLLGIITQDDIADVLIEEATEDMERMGGSQPLDLPYRLAPISLLFRRRIIWLLMLFLAEAYTGTVLRHYSSETEKVIALSWFTPLLIGTGGNIGSQTVTSLIRAIALGEIRLRDIRWVVAKEFAVGLLLGVAMAIFAFGRSELLNVGTKVGFVVALTVLAICVWSATVASVLPLILKKLRIDPAVVSAPLITTVVDGTGLVIYFTIAKLILNL
jgi:magnesium transporter